MILEALRSWVDALEDSAIGVNAKLPGLPQDSGDATPPDILWVEDVTQDDDAFQGRLPPDFPGLVVGPTGAAATADGEVAQTFRDARDVGVVTEYVAGKADLAEGLQDALYTQRAIMRTLEDWMSNSNDSMRTRNDVRVQRCTEIRFGSISVDDANGRIILPATFDFQVRDLKP